jgi:23S rRNA (uridine2552-2'-O)-methyltransferase
MYKVKDAYFKRAKKEGYLARSVYKLKEIDQRYRLFKKGDRVLDLGASPGSWLQYIAQVVGQKGRVLGLDLNPIKWENPPAFVQFWERDVLKWDVNEAKKVADAFDVVVSDMAPATTGIKDVDAFRSFKLANRALEIALALLRPQGHFVCKVLEGGEMKDFLLKCKQQFSFVKVFKPQSSRRESREVFVVALKKK